MIDDFIVQAGDILDSVIINNRINISDMPVVQLQAIILEHDEVFEQFKEKLKNDIVQAEIREIGDSRGRCQVLPLDELLNATID